MSKTIRRTQGASYADLLRAELYRGVRYTRKSTRAQKAFDLRITGLNRRDPRQPVRA